MYKLIVFDIAGTTVIDNGNVANSFHEAFNQFGIEIPFEEIQRVMGWRKIEAINMLLDSYNHDGDIDQNELAKEIHDEFTTIMVDYYNNSEDLKPMPNAEKVFRWLKERDFKIALNTGFTREITDAILKKLHWDDSELIDFTITSDEVAEGRPHPFMIKTIMQVLNITSSTEVIKVGDTEVDVLEGRNANCGLVVAVTTGAYTRDQLELYHPDEIIDDLSELPFLMP